MNVFPIGSYDPIIGMDWLENYKLILNCFDKTFTYVSGDQIIRKIEGAIKPVSVRKISSMQLKNVLERATSCM